MIRLLQVYYPVRTLVLFTVEGLIVCASFVLVLFETVKTILRAGGR